MRPILHIIAHLLVPVAVARAAGRERLRARLAWLWAGLAIDLDHLLATPIYAPGRCSLGFHPLHTLPAAALYATLLLRARTRWLAVGLWLHLALDGLDCWLMR